MPQTHRQGGPLQGVKVLDMSTYLAGPLAAKMLSDLGADVIKVEPPTGDPYRNVGPTREGSSIYWLNANSGKKSVIEGLKRISKPGLRKYVGATEIPRVRGGLGVAVISTSEGVMTDVQARKKNLGGELLCYVW